MALRVRLLPLHPTENGVLLDVGFVSKGELQHRHKHLVREIVGFKTEFEQSRMDRVVVVILRLDARVRHIIDLHIKTQLFSRLPHIVR